MSQPAELDLCFELHERQRGGVAGALSVPPQLRLDQPWSAAAIEQAFERQRAAWYPPALQPHAQRIAHMLAEERALSERWHGLPGTDHPACWDTAADAARARLQRRSGRVALWHPPVAWLMPVLRHTPCDLVIRLPQPELARALEAFTRSALPAGWQRRHVEVQLEVETRVYWGARGDHGEWRACQRRGDGLSRRLPLFALRRGHALPVAPDERAGQDAQEPPRWQRRLAAGVGLLVAMPVLVFERRRCWCDSLRGWWTRSRRRLGWLEERDPTFVARLAFDEPRWNAATGAAPLPPRAWLRAVKDGAVLRPASVPAAHWQRGRPPRRPSAHVVLVHGGLSSVRSAFEALLPQRPGGADRPLWTGMPLLDRACTWRFEHDSFVPVAHNILRLERWLRREVVRDQPAGKLVLLAHSRGGNVVRFALERLRRAFPGWRFAAVTCGSPHLGTQVFSRIGRRWTGLATLVGAVREMTQGWLTRERLAQLVILERGLGYELPPGFNDVEPQGVARMAGGRPHELPAGLWMWGSEWGPGDGQPGFEQGLWDWLVEDLGGAEVDGDGLVARHSALGGLSGPAQGAHDASPVFHTRYFAHPPTRGQIAERLEQLLSD